MAEDKPDSNKAAKDKLKKEGTQINDYGKYLAARTPGGAGMSVDALERWIPAFEQGYVDKTPENDTPYGLETGRRPKVRILDRGTGD